MRSSRPSWRSRIRPALVALVLAIAAAGCGSGATASPTGPAVTDAWVRLPAPMQSFAAAYFTVSGGSQADSIVGAASPIATDVSLHQTVTDASGMTGMEAVDRVDVPAGGTVEFAPGGFHVMLDGLTGTLSVGQTVELTLTFEHAGPITVQAVVRQG